VRWTEQAVQMALTSEVGSLFYCRRYVVIPNLSWGFLNHEADLIALSTSKILHEIEIKVSVADMKAELKKKHIHGDQRVSALWYAVQSEIAEQVKPMLPDRAGLVAVSVRYSSDWGRNVFVTKILKRPRLKNPTYKISAKEEYQLLRLGVMRMWSTRYRNVFLKDGGE